jgi:hypothetical protein
MKIAFVGSLVGILCGLHAGSAEATSSRTTDPEAFAQIKWDNSRQGRPLALTQYKRTFHDDFKTMNIVKEDAAPGSNAVWFAPGHGAFRHDAPLRKDGPFKLVEEGLRLRVEKVGKNWKGACMATVNTRGEGFAQLYGYFEAAIRYDYAGAGTGIWGAFWAKSQKDYATTGTTTHTEIDFNEFYGDNSYHATVHLWPAAKPQSGETILKHLFASGHQHKLAKELFKGLIVDRKVQGFHTYGGEVTPEWVVMYFDRKEVGRFPTMPEWKTPLYLLLDVVMNPREKDKAVFPMDLIVKNVSAYQPVEPYPSQ